MERQYDTGGCCIADTVGVVLQYVIERYIHVSPPQDHSDLLLKYLKVRTSHVLWDGCLIFIVGAIAYVEYFGITSANNPKCPAIRIFSDD